jgi:hypothetical protein
MACVDQGAASLTVADLVSQAADVKSCEELLYVVYVWATVSMDSKGSWVSCCQACCSQHRLFAAQDTPVESRAEQQMARFHLTADCRLQPLACVLEVSVLCLGGNPV